MPRRLLTTLVLATVVVASCSGDAEPGTDETLPGSPGATTSSSSTPDGIPDTTPPTTDTPTGTTRPVPGLPGPPDTVITPDGEPATIVRVLDGDSFMVEVDGREDEVRLIGVNAPEGDECWGDEARDALITLLEGWELTLVAEPGSDDRDRFGRLLRYVFAGGVFVNDELVRTGNAIAFHGDHSAEAVFLGREEAAFDAGYGLFAPAACGVPTPGGALIADLVFDPPGPDDEVANSEVVAFANLGDTPVDLSGWSVRDESSANRFTFPDGTVLGAGAGLLLHSGCGTPDTNDAYWCADGSVWNNGGDTAYLLDPAGNVRDRAPYDGR